MDTTNDLGFMDEIYMIHLMWPDLQKPETQKPVFKQDNGALTITCPTLGASIVYKKSKDQRWLLYHRPLEIEENQTIEATAIRYGYKQSPVVNYQGN